MLFKNKELEKHKEIERLELIEKVVEKFFEFREVVNENHKYLVNLPHHFLTHNMMKSEQYGLYNMNTVFENEEDRNNILANQLEEYSEEFHIISKMKGILSSYKDSQKQLKIAIEDLKHFYRVTKYPSSKTKKILSLEKVLTPIGDLAPLLDIETAYRNIKEFKESHSFRIIEKYLDTDRHGNYIVDEHNIYVVNPYYFSDRVNKLQGVIIRNLELTQKKLWKFTKNHQTIEQLRRYLQY